MVTDKSSDRELLQEIAKTVSNLEGQLLGENGFIKVANTRLNGHAKSINRHNYLFAVMTGGGLVILWLLERIIDHWDKLEATAHALTR